MARQAGISRRETLWRIMAELSERLLNRLAPPPPVPLAPPRPERPYLARKRSLPIAFSSSDWENALDYWATNAPSAGVRAACGTPSPRITGFRSATRAAPAPSPPTSCRSATARAAATTAKATKTPSAGWRSGWASAAPPKNSPRFKPTSRGWRHKATAATAAAAQSRRAARRAGCALAAERSSAPKKPHSSCAAQSARAGCASCLRAITARAAIGLCSPPRCPMWSGAPAGGASSIGTTQMARAGGVAANAAASGRAPSSPQACASGLMPSV